MDPQLQTLGVQLAESTIRNSAQLVADRISAAEARREDRQTIAELEQIVSDLISDKAEIVRIAQAFESELVAQRISDDDVEYISTSVLPILRALAEQGAVGDSSEAERMIDLLAPVLSVEMVTVLQLLGFNFRQALGQPLTALVSRAILAQSVQSSDGGNELRTLQVKRELALIELARDADAYERFHRMIGV